MRYAAHGCMSMTVIAFAVMTSAAVFFMAATMAREMNFHLPAVNQTGDSSLSPRSVNWLAAAAFIAAVLICFVLI